MNDRARVCDRQHESRIRQDWKSRSPIGKYICIAKRLPSCIKDL
ncbi:MULTISPECIES: hypothetical protein [unclassified Microcoleus]|nr:MULTISPECIES: hypothetical protein [unclassified Microcoleus]